MSRELRRRFAVQWRAGKRCWIAAVRLLRTWRAIAGLRPAIRAARTWRAREAFEQEWVMAAKRGLRAPR